MGGQALHEPDDARLRGEPSRAAIEIADGALKLAGFTIAKADGFDDGRLAALLAAAYGEDAQPEASAYLKGALAKQREGQPALAETYLALAGLKPLADPFEAAWRLSAADGLMKAGVAPAVIIDALSAGGAGLQRAYNPDQPRVPQGNGRASGQWTSEDGGQSSSTATAANPTSSNRARPHIVDASSSLVQPAASDGAVDHSSGGRNASQMNPGVPVVLPNGQQVRGDDGTPLMSPVADLSSVAAAGLEVGETYRELLNDPISAIGGGELYLYTALYIYLGHGGVFDYQRQGHVLTGFTQLRQFRNVSNFNVGLFCEEAGFSLDETLSAAGLYAHIFSSNANAASPFGLDAVTEEYTRLGYKIGASGVFDRQ